MLYNGSTGRAYDTDPVPAATAPAGTPAVAVVDYPANGLQNGAPDAVALVRGDQVLEFLSYEGVVPALDGPAAGLTSTDIGLREGGSDPVGQSLARTYDAAADALVRS
ncbi:MAG: endonuclease, partial [Actinomycetes bacterium]